VRAVVGKSSDEMSPVKGITGKFSAAPARRLALILSKVQSEMDALCEWRMIGDCWRRS